MARQEAPKITIGSRLSDPDQVGGDRMEGLKSKISTVLTRLFAKPENGGHPFLFALAAAKDHQLKLKIPGLHMPFKTAATDGKKFFWNPDFLFSLNEDQATVVMLHESFHVCFYHCSRMMAMENKRVANWAVDYVVNGVIWQDHKTTNRKADLWGTAKDPGPLGSPLSLSDLLAAIAGKQDIPDGLHCFADETLYGRSPESIYDEIMAAMEKSPNKCKSCGSVSMGKKKDRGAGKKGEKQQGKGPGKGEKGEKQEGDGEGEGEHSHGEDGEGCGGEGGEACPDCGSKGDMDSMDSHITPVIDKAEIMSELMRAASTVKAMGRGSVPGAVEEALEHLMKPQLKFTDIIRSACARKVADAGLNNDWTRLRRRYLVTNPRQYLPRRHTHTARWLAMIDTSGSMQADDIQYGISQLQCLGDTEGFVVPCDAAVAWDKVTEIKKATDLRGVKIVGRGGTVFDDFFANYKNKLGSDFDCIIVLTDGDCGTIPMNLRPKCDVVWVLTRPKTDYKPSFGRVAPLRQSRM